MIVASLVLAALAVARITYFLVEDYLTNGYRRWVVNKWGEDSKLSYLVHCPWCTSVWVALVIMPIPVFMLMSWTEPITWAVAVLSIPAASMVSGLLIDRKG